MTTGAIDLAGRREDRSPAFPPMPPRTQEVTTMASPYNWVIPALFVLGILGLYGIWHFVIRGLFG